MVSTLLPATTDLWGSPIFVWGIAALGAILLTATWWMLRLSRRRRVRAAVSCVSLSILLHGLLFFLLPGIRQPAGGTPQGDGDEETVVADVTLGHFDPRQPLDEQAAEESSPIAPLPLATPSSQEPNSESASDESNDDAPSEATDSSASEIAHASLVTPASLTRAAEEASESDLDEMLSSMLLPEEPAQGTAVDAAPASPAAAMTADSTERIPGNNADPTAGSTAPPKSVLNDRPSDFAQRFGDAKLAALQRTGGDQQSEQAVEAGLRWLAQYQRSDGSWDPIASGAGRERSPLGLRRDAAGKNSTSGLTGLALLSMLGAGNTHREGPYARNVYSGLSYLIRNQTPDGSLAGEAGTFARTYCHGMAALAICEAAAITGDPQAQDAAKAAVAYTVRLQHPVTGGWRYIARDPGDLSQLGWQAMALESGRRAGVAIPPKTQAGIFRFLESVRGGRHGGLASYRPAEQMTRTMTAEALATRLLLGEPVPAPEVAEAERFLLQAPPGTEQPNLYYWYYASLALHQLQDEAWETWNEHLKQTLTSTQHEDGSWPTDSVWGGYGGRVYTTAVGCLCLEVYYRHTAATQRAASRHDESQR